MKKALLIGLLLSFGAGAAADTKIMESPRRAISNYGLGDGEAIKLSASASTTEHTYDVLLACTSTADCYWDILDDVTGNTSTAAATFTGVTLTATSGWVLIEDVNPFWGIVNWGGNLVLRVMEGGR